MSERSTHISESSSAFPPRYWWLKRCIGGMVILIVLMAGTRWWWGWEADRQFKRRLDLYVSRGEPVRVEELNASPSLDDGPNAASDYRQAIAARAPGVLSPAESATNYLEYPPFPPAWAKAAQAAILANATPLQLMRTARGHATADWGVQFGPTGPVGMLTTLNGSRGLAHLTGDSALYEQVNWNDAEAIERIRDIRHLARMLDAERALVPHMVSNGIDALALDRLQVISSGLTIGPGDAPANPDTKPATRKQIKELIAELLGDSDQFSGIQDALKTERVLELNAASQKTSNLWLLRPMTELDTLRLASNFDAAILMARHPDANASTSLRRTFNARPALYAPTLISAGASLSHDRIILLDAKLNADRRMAAVSLAAQLYHADHGGAWPQSLESLVPVYLPEVPEDPLAAAPQTPLGYLLVPHGRPDGADRPLVYSVGEDQKDDSRDAAEKGMALLPAEPSYSWGFRTLDQWRDLSRWVPTGDRQASGLPPDPPADVPLLEESPGSVGDATTTTTQPAPTDGN